MTQPSPNTWVPSLRDAFARHVRRTLGLVFPASRGEALDHGIARAASALDQAPAALLLRLADNDPAALAALAAELTIGETYFFRHAHHFDFLRAALRARPAGKPIRLWSAGCATGEEAYSMAIAALEALGPAALTGVVIVATDVNPAALERARAATYGEWSFRSVPVEVRERWFEPEGAQLRVNDAPRSMVRFALRNLLDDEPEGRAPELWAAGIDVIFCRNVMIYFDEAATLRATAQLAGALAPGGQLVPGPSDPLLRSELLRLDPPAGLITYRRACDVRLEPARAVTVDLPPPRLEPARAAPVSGRSPAPSRVRASSEAAPTSAGTRTPLEQARELADRGESAAALELIERDVTRDPLQEEAYALRAVLGQSLGDHARAAADADRAILLRRSFAFAHVLAAVSRSHLGERAQARRHLRNARRLLSALAVDAPVPGAGGATAAELLDACQQLGQTLATPRLDGARRAAR